MAYPGTVSRMANGATIASTTTIAPTNDVTIISGTNAIATIRSPFPSGSGGQITFLPSGIFTTVTTGNIILASTAVVGKAMIMTLEPVAGKWYPSY